MRIEIDFDNKIVEVKDSTTVGQLVEKLKELNLKDWKDYTLKTDKEYVWYPITIPSIPQYPTITYYPVNPWGWPTITCGEITYALTEKESVIC